MNRRCTALLLVFLCLRPWFCLGQDGRGGEQGADVRYAIVVGANQGSAADGAALQYADDDARELADVLVELGGIEPQHLELLTAATVDQIRVAFARVAAGVTQARASGKATLAVFYYSGHAGFDGLHVGAETISAAEVRDLVASVPADVRVAVVDACHSGALVQLKGGTPVAPFLSPAHPPDPAEGTAWLMSCGADEKAQESEEFGHAVFTYWLLAGLRGAADMSGDGWVTLPEVWEHARSGTAMTTTRTRLPQRPAWEVNVKGRDGVRLTTLHAAGSDTAVIELPEPGDYWVFREGQLVAEVYAQLPGHRLALRPGDYLVRRIGPGDELLEAELSMVGGERRVLSADRMDEVPYVRLASKGRGVGNWLRHGPMALVQYQGESLDGFGTAMGGGVAWPLIAGGVWLTPRLMGSASSLKMETVAVNMTEVELDAAVGYGIELGPAVLRPQISAGGTLGTQSIDDLLLDRTQRRTSVGPQVGGGLALTFVPFDGRGYLDLSAEGLLRFFRRDPGSGRNPEWQETPAFRILMGLGYVL